MKPIEFSAHGLDPVPYSQGGPAMQAWRQLVYDQALQQRKHLKNENVTEQNWFTIDLQFTLRQERMDDSDLENLSIPVLNTIFQDAKKDSGYATGALFSFPDVRVRSLTIVKSPPLKGMPIGVFVHIDW